LQIQLKEVLSNSRHAEEIALSGYRYLGNRFTYDEMAQEIVDKYRSLSSKA
jgi:rubrerythrin